VDVLSWRVTLAGDLFAGLCLGRGGEAQPRLPEVPDSSHVALQHFSEISVVDGLEAVVLEDAVSFESDLVDLPEISDEAAPPPLHLLLGQACVQTAAHLAQL